MSEISAGEPLRSTAEGQWFDKDNGYIVIRSERYADNESFCYINWTVKSGGTWSGRIFESVGKYMPKIAVFPWHERFSNDIVCMVYWVTVGEKILTLQSVGGKNTITKTSYTYNFERQ